MSKELLISLILAALLVCCVLLGLIQSDLLSNPFFLLFGLATILGQVVMAHLAFNQYKNFSTQTTKESISDALSGVEIEGDSNGIKIFKCNGWDYSSLFLTYKKAVNFTREFHKPSLVHVEEITQPQGHSTSGSHERYKSKDRLSWESEYDCIKQFKKWILSSSNAMNEPICNLETLETIENDAKIVGCEIINVSFSKHATQRPKPIDIGTEKRIDKSVSKSQFETRKSPREK